MNSASPLTVLPVHPSINNQHWSGQRFISSKMQCCVTKQSRSNLVTAIHILHFITVTVKRCTCSISILKICYLVFSYLSCLYSHLLRMQIHYCKGSNTTKPPTIQKLLLFLLTFPVSKKVSNKITAVNILPLGHVETRDCYPMCCWRVTHFYVFLHDVLHMHLSSGLAHFPLQGYPQFDAGCLGLKSQIIRPVMTPYF